MQQFLLFENNAKMGSVQVIIDGKSLHSADGFGQAAPAYFPRNVKITSIEHRQDLVGTNHEVTAVFNIQDMYKTYHTTPSNNFLTISVDGDLTFNHETAPNYLKCTITTPTDSAPNSRSSVG